MVCPSCNHSVYSSLSLCWQSDPSCRPYRIILSSLGWPITCVRRNQEVTGSHGELHAYNIVVEFQDAATLFGVNPLPQPAVAAELLNNVAADDMANDANYKLIRYMDFATYRGIHGGQFRRPFAHVVVLRVTIQDGAHTRRHSTRYLWTGMSCKNR
ncbi:hypothetical protein HD554DRAFT_1212455 [Boletus coccyginus]|nr:hypothetical protein HD554DRAFT_1212455 [Boletus coccyginus]